MDTKCCHFVKIRILTGYPHPSAFVPVQNQPTKLSRWKSDHLVVLVTLNSLEGTSFGHSVGF